MTPQAVEIAANETCNYCDERDSRFQRDLGDSSPLDMAWLLMCLYCIRNDHIGGLELHENAMKRFVARRMTKALPTEN